MTNPTLTVALRALPHFRGVSNESLARVAAACTSRKLRAGEPVFREGETCRAFFAVVTGGAVVFRSGEDGRRQILHRIKPGMSFAEAAALTMKIYPASAEATVDDTEIIAIDGKRILGEFQADPSLAGAMVGSLCMWLMRLVERVDELSAASAGARLARHLLRLPASGAGADLRIELPMAKKDLAAHLAITPETLSRLLKRWGDRGIVDNEGKTLVIKDPESLETIATGAEAD